jgi:hypothetical protein
MSTQQVEIDQRIVQIKLKVDQIESILGIPTFGPPSNDEANKLLIHETLSQIKKMKESILQKNKHIEAYLQFSSKERVRKMTRWVLQSGTKSTWSNRWRTSQTRSPKYRSILRRSHLSSIRSKTLRYSPPVMKENTRRLGGQRHNQLGSEGGGSAQAYQRHGSCRV